MPTYDITASKHAHAVNGLEINTTIRGLGPIVIHKGKATRMEMDEDSKKALEEAGFTVELVSAKQLKADKAKE